MPIDAPQLPTVSQRKSFGELVSAVNDVIVIVNGLPATTTGQIGRLGGVIDGLSSGTILDFPSGSLFIVNDGALAVGDFLDDNQPAAASGKLHVHSADSDAAMYISQNTAGSTSALVFQTANSSSWTGSGSSESKTAGIIGTFSNTSTQSSILTLVSANVNHSVIPTTMFDTISNWGGTSDVDAIARLSLISGDIQTIAPSGGPHIHSNAPLRIQRAVAYDSDVANTTPILSILGYSGAVSPNVPTRAVIGDLTSSASHDVSNAFGVFDFLGDGSDIADTDHIKGRISGSYDTESGVAGSLSFSVRQATGSLFTPLRIVGGDTAANEGKIIVSNTSVVDSFSKENVTTIADEIGQVAIRQFHHASKGTTHMGLMVQGSDTAASGEEAPIIRLENVLAARS
jgi:hypothetical protein